MKTTNLKYRDLRKEYKFIPFNLLKMRIKNRSGESDRVFLNKLKKENSIFEEKALRQDVKFIEVDIEWKKSRIYGYNPVASVRWETVDGVFHYEPNFTRASGGGYDKGSAVLGACLNHVLSGMFFRKRHKKSVPYGVNLSFGWEGHISCGIGFSSFYEIAAFFGLKMEHVASSDTYDKFVFKKAK